MPKLHSKTKVLGGRAQVISYERDPSIYYYRELVTGTTSYKTKRLEATTLEAAQLEAVDAYASLRVPSEPALSVSSTPQPSQSARTIKRVVRDYLTVLQKQVTAKQIQQGTYDVAENVVYKLLLPFCDSHNIIKTNEININTFNDYKVWRQKTASGRHNILKRGEGVTPLTLQKEMVQIKKFVNVYLLPNKLIKSDLANDKNFIVYPKVRAEDLLANPAINQADWETIINYVRKEWRGDAAKYRKGYWSRTMFWNWMLISKNTGARPEELLKLRWKDIEYEDIGRFSKTAQKDRIQEMISMGLPIDEENLDELGQVSHENAHVVLKSAKTGQSRISSCNCVYVFERWLKFQKEYAKENGLTIEVNPNSLVWEYPENQGKTLSYSRYKQLWIEIRDVIGRKLKGHVFSDEPYTIYSFRSTFIEDSLLAGKDIFLVAKAAGHDVKTLMKHYERIDPRKRSREMTSFEMGAKPKTVKRSAV